MKPEIFLLMEIGLTNKEIAEKTGYSSSLVAYYRISYREAKKRFVELMKGGKK